MTALLSAAIVDAQILRGLEGKYDVIVCDNIQRSLNSFYDLESKIDVGFSYCHFAV